MSWPILFSLFSSWFAEALATEEYRLADRIGTLLTILHRSGQDVPAVIALILDEFEGAQVEKDGTEQPGQPATVEAVMQELERLLRAYGLLPPEGTTREAALLYESMATSVRIASRPMAARSPQPADVLYRRDSASEGGLPRGELASLSSWTSTEADRARL